MTGNYMGSPQTNHNYPQNPNNNARQSGGGGDSQPQGDKFTLTSQKGTPSQQQMPVAAGIGVPTAPMVRLRPGMGGGFAQRAAQRR